MSTTTEFAVKVQAADVTIGDQVSRTRDGDYHAVTAISVGERARRISLDGAGNIRPRHTTELWLLAEATTPDVADFKGTEPVAVDNDTGVGAALERARLPLHTTLTPEQADRARNWAQDHAGLQGKALARWIIDGVNGTDQVAEAQQAVKAEARQRRSTAAKARQRPAGDVPVAGTDEQNREAADLGNAEGAAQGHPIAQALSVEQVARVRAATGAWTSIPAGLHLKERELRGFVNGTIDRMDLPADGRDALANVTAAVKTSPRYWPRKVAAAAWGLHVQAKRAARQG